MSSTSNDVLFRPVRVKSLELKNRIVMTRFHAPGASPARATPLISDGALKDRLASSWRRERSLIGLHGGERSDAASLDHSIAVGCALISDSHWAEKVKAHRRDNPAEIGELA